MSARHLGVFVGVTLTLCLACVSDTSDPGGTPDTPYLLDSLLGTWSRAVGTYDYDTCSMGITASEYYYWTSVGPDQLRITDAARFVRFFSTFEDCSMASYLVQEAGDVEFGPDGVFELVTDSIQSNSTVNFLDGYTLLYEGAPTCDRRTLCRYQGDTIHEVIGDSLLARWAPDTNIQTTFGRLDSLHGRFCWQHADTNIIRVYDDTVCAEDSTRECSGVTKVHWYDDCSANRLYLSENLLRVFYPNYACAVGGRGEPSATGCLDLYGYRPGTACGAVFTGSWHVNVNDSLATADRLRSVVIDFGNGDPGPLEVTVYRSMAEDLWIAAWQ